MSGQADDGPYRAVWKCVVGLVRAIEVTTRKHAGP